MRRVPGLKWGRGTTYRRQLQIPNRPLSLGQPLSTDRKTKQNKTKHDVSCEEGAMTGAPTRTQTLRNGCQRVDGVERRTTGGVQRTQRNARRLRPSALEAGTGRHEVWGQTTQRHALIRGAGNRPHAQTTYTDIKLGEQAPSHRCRTEETLKRTTWGCTAGLIGGSGNTSPDERGQASVLHRGQHPIRTQQTAAARPKNSTSDGTR